MDPHLSIENEDFFSFYNFVDGTESIESKVVWFFIVKMRLQLSITGDYLNADAERAEEDQGRAEVQQRLLAVLGPFRLRQYVHRQQRRQLLALAVMP